MNTPSVPRLQVERREAVNRDFIIASDEPVTQEKALRAIADGLGVKPPTPEWGIMVAEGAANIISGEWWIALFPGAALMIAVFCFNLLGDGLRDLVDPQRRT